ncbi:MAG: biopolymer transporter ExbD [Synechococcaceae cyanobacterium]
MLYLPEDSDDDFELNIVSMIDVIFAILTFFIISTLFLTRSQALPVNLPKASSAEPQQRARVTVSVGEAGAIALNREAIALADLQSAVRELVGSPKPSVVVIHADAGVSHGRVVSVMDELRGVEGAVLGISTRRAD